MANIGHVGLAQHTGVGAQRSTALRSLMDAAAPEDSVAIIKDGERWTKMRLAREADRLAAGLANAGVRPGDRVALHLRNGPEMAVAYFACFRLGAIAAPLNLRFKTRELDATLRRLRPALYIGHVDLYRLVASVGTEILPAGARYVVGEPEDTHARRWTSLHRDPGSVALNDPDESLPAVLLSTSGTTGQPKLVAHSQATLVRGLLGCANLNLRQGDVFAFFLPMVHGSGLYSFLAGLMAGATLVMLDAADPDSILDAIEAHHCTYFVALPTMAAALMDRQQVRPRDTRSLRFCLTGGDVCLPGQQEAFPELFGVPLHSFWASSEGLGSLTYTHRNGPFSRQVPGVEIRLVDGDDRIVRRGEPGEMVVRGPHVALGYWTAPGEWDGFENGWYRTGDVMCEEADGEFRFVARAKHLIVRGGSNISPVEVEQILASHPSVADAAVIGVPDPRFGQSVIGFVQLAKAEGRIGPDEILRFASDHLADYKMPERLLAVPAIPRNALGKIDRVELSKLV